MITNVFVRLAGVALASGLSTLAWAGGAPHGGRVPMRPPMLHAVMPPAGHVRVAVRPIWGHPAPGTAWGVHGRGPFPSIGGSRRLAFDAGREGAVYGHTRTGFGRLRPAERFAIRRDRGYGYGEGPGLFEGELGQGRAIEDTGSGSIYVVGGGSEDRGSTETGYDGPMGEGFAEPPLNMIGSGARILTVGAEPSRLAGGCACRADGPAVYRFGVGSYY